MKRSKILVFLFVIYCTFFLLLELVFRIAGYHGMNIDFNPLEYSEEYGWKLKNNYNARWTKMEWDFDYRTNSRGLRDDEEHSFERSDNDTRILILGDSFGEGYGVPLAKAWQTILKTKIPQKTEIINLSVRGNDIIREYHQLTNIGLLYNPDIVVQLLSPNDWGKDGAHSLTIGDDAMLRFSPPYLLEDGNIFFQKVPVQGKSVLTDNPVIHSIKKIIYKSAVVAFIRYEIVEYAFVKKILYVLGLRNYDKSVAQLMLDNDPYNSGYEEAVDVIYKNTKKITREKNIKYLIVFVGLPEHSMPRSLAGLLEKYEYPYTSIDLSRDEQFKFDGHPNSIAQGRIAEVIAVSLKDLLQDQGE